MKRIFVIGLVTCLFLVCRAPAIADDATIQCLPLSECVDNSVQSSLNECGQRAGLCNVWSDTYVLTASGLAFNALRERDCEAKANNRKFDSNNQCRRCFGKAIKKLQRLAKADNAKLISSLVDNAVTELGKKRDNSCSQYGGTQAIFLSGNLAADTPIITSPPDPTSFTDYQSIDNSTSFYTGVPIYDSSGAPHGVSIYFSHVGENSWLVTVYVNSFEDFGAIGGVVPIFVGSTTLDFDGLQTVASQSQLVINPQWSNGASPRAVVVNPASLTQFATGTALSSQSQ